MPTEYKRKVGSLRGSWSEDNLNKAIEAIQNNTIGINEAARYYSIPKTTLKRRLKNNVLTKNSMGRGSLLGAENEKKIVKHISKLQACGFTPTRETVRTMAFKLAEKLKIEHNFDRETEMAGYDWLSSFLRRNPELSIRKSEGVSKNRAIGMNKAAVKEYFELLENTLVTNDLLNKPGHVFNMDESGLQLNNKAGNVIAMKGSKSVSTITSGEKGETISVVCCCNGEGNYIPPYCIFKGKNKKNEFEDGMPPGSRVVMNQKSAYMNSDIFLDWLKMQFMPRKPPGKVLLILDGHSSHCSSVEMLEYADDNNIILLGLPSHTTHFLQPLDRTFFKSLKSNYNAVCSTFMKNNPSRQITRLQFGKLLGQAWSKSASVDNALSGFKSCGVIPLNMSAIPDYAYLVPQQEPAINDMSNKSTAQIDLHAPQQTTNEVTEPGSTHAVSKDNNSLTATSSQQSDVHLQEKFHKNIDESLSKPSTSGLCQRPISKSFDDKNLTPSKILDLLTPIPSLQKKQTARGKAASVAKVLNSPENINNIIQAQKIKEEKNIKKEENKKIRELKRKMPTVKSKTVKVRKIVSNKFKKTIMCDDSESDEFDFNDNECVGCMEDYNETSSTEDWIKCSTCSRWMHENCTKFGEICDYCGKKELKNKQLTSKKLN